LQQQESLGSPTGGPASTCAASISPSWQILHHELARLRHRHRFQAAVPAGCTAEHNVTTRCGATSCALLLWNTADCPAWFQFAQHNCHLPSSLCGSAVEEQQLLIEVATETVRHYAAAQ
jgi:hypothetical protein